MNSIKQWIEENNFCNVFSTKNHRLIYKDFPLLFEITTKEFIISTHIDGNSLKLYTTIEEVLLHLDKHGLFRNDLKWKMIMTIIKERMTCA